MKTILPAVGVFLTACLGGPRIDEGNCKQSLEEQAKYASSSKDSAAYSKQLVGLRVALVAGQMTQNMSRGLAAMLGNDNGTSVDLPRAGKDEYELAICTTLDGYTVKRVVTEGDSIASKVSSALRRITVDNHIQVLETAKKEAAIVLDSIAQFVVLESKLVQETNILGMLDATIILTIENKTNHHISRAYFTGTAISEGRKVPWLRETFNYSISGGIAPNEKQTWRLTPSIYSGSWSTTRIPRDAKFVVTVNKLEDEGQNPLWGGVQFNEADEALLDSLKKTRR